MQPLKEAVPGALVPLLEAVPLSNGKVDFVWRVAVGPAFRRVTTVVLDGTVLVVDAATPYWTREVKRSADVILRRLQSLLGADAVTSLRIRSAREP